MAVSGPSHLGPPPHSAEPKRANKSREKPCGRDNPTGRQHREMPAIYVSSEITNGSVIAENAVPYRTVRAESGTLMPSARAMT